MSFRSAVILACLISCAWQAEAAATQARAKKHNTDKVLRKLRPEKETEGRR